MDSDALIRTTRTNNVIFGGNSNGNFIFPDFQYAFDGIMALAKLLEFMATQNVSISDIVLNLPPYYVARATGFLYLGSKT